jgi:FtsZ-interacting cell division protein ZipA
MSTTVGLIIVVVVLVVILAIIAVIVRGRAQRQRSEQLRQRFGPEYDRTLSQTWDQGQAESALEQRVQRVQKLSIRPLSTADAARFNDSWRSLQGQFVDDPPGAVRQADQLIGSVMEARGYPVSDFEQQAADISVEHPTVVENYRTAHAIAQQSANGQASTEELRKATIAYRSLFQELVGTPESMPEEAQR